MFASSGYSHIISISDLHLSASQSMPNIPPTVIEGFFYDEAMVQFTRYLVRLAENEGGIWHLLILGDGFDFLHTRIGPSTANLSPASTFSDSRLKLDLIFSAHPRFFEALGHLLAAGFHIDIVPGNHDIELIRSDTQIHFKSLMYKYAAVDSVDERLHFFPWIYHIPGVLYAEHGNQHHDINSFDTLLAPLKDLHNGEISFPLGAYYDLYLFYLLEHIIPLTESTRAPLKYILREIRAHPMAFVAQFPVHLYFIRHVIRYLLYRISPFLYIKRRSYHRELFAEYATQSGFDIFTLSILDNLAAIPGTRLLGRVFRKVIHSGKNKVHEDYLQQAAKKIHTALKNQKMETLFYLFGHSHFPIKKPIDGTSFYLNDGAWSSDEYRGMPGDQTRFPYVHIRWGGETSPEATLFHFKMGD